MQLKFQEIMMIDKRALKMHEGFMLKHNSYHFSPFVVKSQFDKKLFEGTHGFEPWTYRTAADCSTTELYPPVM